MKPERAWKVLNKIEPASGLDIVAQWAAITVDDVNERAARNITRLLVHLYDYEMVELVDGTLDEPRFATWRTLPWPSDSQERWELRREIAQSWTDEVRDIPVHGEEA